MYKKTEKLVSRAGRLKVRLCKDKRRRRKQKITQLKSMSNSGEKGILQPGKVKKEN